MHGIAPLIQDLAIILGVAGIVTLVFQKIRQPVVLGYLLAGLIIGPYTPPFPLVSDIPNIKVLAELGVIFLMFSLGLDFSFHKLARVGFSASITGTLEVILMLLIGFILGRALGWSINDSLFLGAALSISSTTIIIKALHELRLQHRRFAELIFGILIVEDLLAILLLVALSTVVVTTHFFSMSMAWATLKLILVVGSWFIVGYFLVPTLLRKVIHYINSETLTIISIALCLILVSIAAFFNYSAALGAFIMGSILAETPEVHRIENLIRPIRDVFAAVFFVSVGMLINPKIIINQFPIVMLVSLITIFGKIITSGLGAFLTGQSLKTSLRVGFGMAQIGEFSFIIAGLGVALGAVSDSLYPIIVAVSVITTFTTPYSIRFSGYLSDVFEKRLPPKIRYFIESYSTWFYRTQADRKHRATYRRALIRFIINSIIVAIIFILCENLLVLKLATYIKHLALLKISVWLIALVLSSPFIWAMLFAFRTKERLTLPTVFAGLFTFIEISLLSIAYFDTWLVMIIMIVIAIGLLILLYNQLETSYHWFEKRLVTNLRKLDDLQYKKFEQLAPWDTHLVQMTVSPDSPLADKTLEGGSLRQKYGINVVAIHRGSKTLLAPRGKERLLPQDKLVILGNDDQIENFQKISEKTLMVDNNNYSLENFSLKSLLLKERNPLIGKTIRATKIREKISGIIVGLERNDIRILNPDPATVLQEEDLLFVVGETHLLDKYSPLLEDIY